MKLRIMVLALVGVSGLAASYALANTGRGHHHVGFQSTTTSCTRALVVGTTSSPQTFVVTVTKSWKNSPFAPGKVVTVSVGSSGTPLQILAGGCVNGSTIDARSAGLSSPWPKPTTSGATTTSTTTTGKANHHGHHWWGKGGTTTSTTTSP